MRTFIRTAGVGLLATVAVLGSATAAFADAGDVIGTVSSTGAEISTNQCGGYSQTTTDGTPGQTDQKMTVVFGGQPINGGQCQVTSRIVYVDTAGVLRATRYGVSNGGQDVGVLAAIGVRCRTELQVRRLNGSVLAVNSVSTRNFPGCNGVIQY